MSLQDTYSSLESATVTISANASFSSAINCCGLRLFSLVVPSDWTSASLTFQTSFDGGMTWVNLLDQSGNEITAAAAASSCIVLTPTSFASAPYLRVRSGTAALPVLQAADRPIKLILRSI